MLKYALRYYQKYGWEVLPSRDKRALVSGWGKDGDLEITEEKIKEWWDDEFRDANICVITGSKSGILVLDTDSEAAERQVLDLLPTGFTCPTVKTPRKGRHRYFSYQEGFSSRRYIEDLDIKTDGGLVVLPPSKNAKGDYKWLITPKEILPPPLPDRLAKFLLQLSTPSTSSTLSTISTMGLSFEKGNRNESLFHTAVSLVRGGMLEDNILNLLLYINNAICVPPLSAKEVEIIFNSAVSKRNRNIAGDVLEAIQSTSGYISFHDLSTLSTLSTLKEKKAGHQALCRLVEKGIVERHPTKSSIYRLIEKGSSVIDFCGADESEIQFKWPLGIEKLFKLMKKNIVIVTSPPDCGKTAFLLSTVFLNMDCHDIYYFSSEMGDSEFKSRLIPFGVPLEDWKFVAKEKDSDFHDEIEPDAINIIDYLEMHDNFYIIGGKINQIFRKLKSGVAIIAVQQNYGTEWPLGGLRAMEKARLAISLHPHRPGNVAKILKAKNWRTKRSPKNLKKTFMLYDGHDFSETSSWEY